MIVSYTYRDGKSNGEISRGHIGSQQMIFEKLLTELGIVVDT